MILCNFWKNNYPQKQNSADPVVTPYNIVGLFEDLHVAGADFMGIEHYNYNKLIFITFPDNKYNPLRARRKS